MEGIRLFTPDSESFFFSSLTPESRQFSSLYLMVVVQWKLGPIVNSSYNTWWHWEDLHCDECVGGCRVGVCCFLRVICWAEVRRAVGRHTHTVPGAGSRKRSPWEESRAGV